MNPKRTGDLAALTCALACGLGNIPAKVGLTSISPELFNFFLFLAASVFSALSLFKARYRAEVTQIRSSTLALIFVLSLLFAIALTLNMTALKLLEPATASFLSRFEVILTIALAYFILREKLGFMEILGGGIALAGVFVLRFKTNLVISQGSSLMILSGLFFATSEIIIKKNIATISTVSFLFYRNIFLIPILLGIILLHGQPLYMPSGKTVLLIAAASLLLPVIGRATYQTALKRIDISRAALITQTTPLFTALFAFLLLRTLPSPIEWLGSGLIILGASVVSFSHCLARVRMGAMLKPFASKL